MILDRQSALGRIEHDAELYHEICEIFRNDVPVLLANLKLAIKNGEITVATRHAHSLKSSAANIGADELCESAHLAETTLRSGNSDDLTALIPVLDQKLAAVMKELS